METILYNCYDELDVNDLKNKVIEQCKMLGVYIQNNIIDMKKTRYQGQPALMIHIEGIETYPTGYMADSIGTSTRYLIGVTFDDIGKMIYNINKEGGI